MSIFGEAVTPEVPPRDDEKPWAIITSLSFLFCSIFLPLIVYFVKKGDSPFAARVALNTLAFQVALFAFQFVAIVLWMIVMGVSMAAIAALGGNGGQPGPLIVVPIVAHFLFVLIMIAIGFGALALSIVATIHVASGKVYRYPFVSRFVE